MILLTRLAGLMLLAGLVAAMFLLALPPLPARGALQVLVQNASIPPPLTSPPKQTQATQTSFDFAPAMSLLSSSVQSATQKRAVPPNTVSIPDYPATQTSMPSSNTTVNASSVNVPRPQILAAIDELRAATEAVSNATVDEALVSIEEVLVEILQVLEGHVADAKESLAAYIATAMLPVLPVPTGGDTSGAVRATNYDDEEVPVQDKRCVSNEREATALVNAEVTLSSWRHFVANKSINPSR